MKRKAIGIFRNACFSATIVVLASMLLAPVGAAGIVIGPTDTGWVDPSANNIGNGGAAFNTHPDYAYHNDTDYASNLNGLNESNTYYGYGFPTIPSGATINGIELRLDWWVNTSSFTCSLQLAVSWDGGATWSDPPKAANNEQQSDGNPTTILGSSSDLWVDSGTHTWVPGDFTGNNFRVKITCNGSCPPIDDGHEDPGGKVIVQPDFYLDWIPVKVYYTPSSPGTIYITKGTDPADSANPKIDFSFTDNIASPNSFTLTDGDTKTFSSVTPGTYIITEGDPSADGYILTSIQVSEGTANSSVDLANSKATIVLDSGETVTVTFTNSEPGEIQVNKVTDPADSANPKTDFGFTDDIAPYPDDSFILTDGDTKTFSNVTPGTYTITEGDPSADGYILTDIQVNEDGTGNSSTDKDNLKASASLDPGETIVITFTNTFDQCPNDPNKTEPGACGCGVADTDTDGDGTADCNDGCPADPLKVAPGACGCGVADADSDGDGTPDCNDGCPTDPLKVAPGACGCGVADTDSDGDGTANCNDGCPADPLKVAPGTCGCGVADTDTDGDGTPDCNDGCPADINKTAPGTCGCGVADTDSDGDGTADCNDGCPNDPNKTSPGDCGCGVADTDSDQDGTPNCKDNCSSVDNPGQQNNDGDSYGNACDNCPNRTNQDQADSDGDSVGNVCDNCPAKANTDQVDGDKDGKGDACDTCPNDAANDADKDGICGNVDNCPTVYNPTQEDNDGNGIGNACELPGDVNSDRKVDSNDVTIILSCLNVSKPSATCLKADLNGDGIITSTDIQLLINKYPILARDTRLRRYLR